MADDKMRGHFVWHDLMTTDTGGAISFYRDVVGWGTKAWDGSEYTMWTAGKDAVGGVVRLDDEAAKNIPPHWLAYTSVPDTDAASTRTVELGGQVLHGPADIPTVGRFAVLADPQGAVFAVFTPDNGPPGPRGRLKSGHFSWHELATTDYEAAMSFYADLFGWNVTEDFDMGEVGIYRMFGHGRTTYGAMYNKSETVPGPPYWLYYVTVPDIDWAAETVVAKGGKVLNGPMAVPGGERVAQCTDPQGAAFALHTRRSA